MKRAPLQRKTPLRTHRSLQRAPMKRRGPSNAAKRRAFSPDIVAYIKQRSQGVCEWCGTRPATTIHHCKFRSQLTRSEGSGGKENALHICPWCDTLVHGGKEGQKYRELFVQRAKKLAATQQLSIP